MIARSNLIELNQDGMNISQIKLLSKELNFNRKVSDGWYSRRIFVIELEGLKELNY